MRCTGHYTAAHRNVTITTKNGGVDFGLVVARRFYWISKLSPTWSPNKPGFYRIFRYLRVFGYFDANVGGSSEEEQAEALSESVDFSMGRRTLQARNEEAERARAALKEAPASVKAAGNVVKAQHLLTMDFTITTLSTVLGLSRSKITRIRDSMKADRQPAKNGRPTYLNAGAEIELGDWIRAENNAGRGPTLEATKWQVRTHTLFKSPFHITY